MSSPPPPDDPGQTFLVDPDRDPFYPPTGTEDRRQAASTMVQDLLTNTPLSTQDLAQRFGRGKDTIEKWRLGATAPTARDFHDLWQCWNYHMAATKAGQKPQNPW